MDFAKKDSIRYYQERERAFQFALSKGYPTSGQSRVQSFSLQGFDDFEYLQYYKSDNAISAAIMGTDQLYPSGDAELSLTGNGGVLAMWEVDRPRTTHVELNNRITAADNSNHPIDDHATHVAGTMIAAGVNPNARGMAYQASLASYDADNDVSEMATAAGQGARLSNHSYGLPAGWDAHDLSGNGGWHWVGNTSVSQASDYLFGLYDSEARDYDNIVFNAPFYLPVKSSGNDRGEGPSSGTQHWVPNSSGQWISSNISRPLDGGSSGYDCIPTTGNAKNILTVGAIEAQESSGLLILGISDFSSWGPTDDGRIKPDIVARGVDVFSSFSNSNSSYGTISGTSMAAPAVTGSLGLLLQHYANVNAGFTMRASALKALVLHTADQIGASDAPNYRTGWGLMNTRAAADHISHSINSYSGDRLISRDSITNGGFRERTYYHDGEGSFKVTLVWTDPAGPISSNTLNPTQKRLVNDLDIRLVRDSDGTVYSPWVLNPASPSSAATKGDNSRDNVEQIFETNLLRGTYTIRITHKGTLVGSEQYFSMIISGKANYTTNCSGTLTDGSGNQNYVSNGYHSWTIEPSNANSITLNFTAFNTEEDFDFVKIYNGLDTNAPLIGEYSGSSLPPAITANSGKMHIVFEADESITETGWNATYSCTSGQLSVSPSSFNFSANGGNNTVSVTATCNWSIQGILPPWLNASPNSGNSNATISIVCSPNPSEISRTTTITINACNGLSQSITITQAGCTPPTTPILSQSSSINICNGQTIPLSVTNACSGCTITWSNGQTGSSINVSASGSYVATASNNCGTGVSSQAITVTVSNIPTAATITASGATALCQGQSVTLNAGGVCNGCTVNWSNGMTGTSISVSSAGNYSATVTNPANATGCAASPASNTITVTTASAPAAAVIAANGSTTLCPGQSVALNASNTCSGCTVQWSNGANGQSIIITDAGTYTAMVLSPNCGTSVSSNAITITTASVPAAPIIAINGSSQLCPGQSVTLNASKVCNGCNVTWSNGMSGPSITVSSAGTYTATVSSPNCGTSPSSNSVTITSASTLIPPTITATWRHQSLPRRNCGIIS
ncbi:MAG: S8 family serine peptidase [Saprospiraceae bacterium]|nr:S8 family serine peptidase [Saprospiraceae bacterium]